MRKSLFFLFLLIFSNSYSQENWQLLNPKPSPDTGLDVAFVSSTNGFYITSNQLFYTTDTGDNWQLKSIVNGAKDLAFKNNIGYVVGSHGSVLKTSDSGITWSSRNITGGESLNSVTIIDDDNLIVSGNSIAYFSSDGGSSWISKNIPNSRVNKTFFLSATLGHAVTDDGQIFKTIDGGGSWYVTASYVNYMPNSFFTIYFKNESVGFATREHNEFYKTTDGGETWTVIDDGISDAIYSFHFVDNLIGYAVGEYGMFKTTNGGDKWTRISIEQGHYSYTDMFGVYFLNENQGFAVGHRGRIAKTIDAGKTWELYSPLETSISQVECLSPSKIVVRSGSSFYRSTDNGESWGYLGTSGENINTGEFDFVNENIGYCIAGGAAGTSSSADDIYKTNDGGLTWEITTNFGLYFDYGASSLDFVNENLGFVSGGYNQRRTYKTTDGGELWRVVLQESFNQIQFVDEKTGYGRSTYRGVYKTIDGGENWAIIFSSEKNVKSIYFIDDQNGFVIGQDGMAFKTEDGGDTWKEIDLPYLDFEYVRFYSKNVGYAFEDYGKLFKTVDGGHSWEKIYQLSGLTDLALNDEGQIYITGSYGKILKSDVTYTDLNLFVKEAKNITVSSATIGCSIASNSEDVTNIRIEFGKNMDFSNSQDLDPNFIPGNTNVSLDTQISGLFPNTKYYYRIVATHNGKNYYSNVRNFTTLVSYSIDMYGANASNAYAANIYGSVLSNSEELNDIIFEFGVNADNLSNEVNASPESVEGNGIQTSVEALLENLETETTYFVRLKASYDGETIVSNIISFTTQPEFRIISYNPWLSNSEAEIQAYIYAFKDDITDIVIEYGKEKYENEQSVTPNIMNVNTNGFVTTTLTGLDTEALYYYRIKAKHGDKTIYGPEELFSFTEKVVLINNEAVDIRRESALINGKVFSSKNYLHSIVIEYGETLEYGNETYATPNYSGPGRTTGISARLFNLIPEATYNYRIKTKNSVGEFYSENLTFTTLDKLPSNNFKITTTNETCVNKKNGTVYIETIEIGEYEALLNYDSFTFEESLFINDLEPGVYNLLIQEKFGTPHYYRFEISKSQELSAKSTIKTIQSKKIVDVTINNGTHPYSVFINKQKIEEFDYENFSFEVNSGDFVEITSKYECEGKFEFVVSNDLKSDLFNNPVETQITLNIVENNQLVYIDLFSISGNLLGAFKEYAVNNQVKVDLQNYPVGVYLIKITGNTIRTHKIIKL